MQNRYTARTRVIWDRFQLLFFIAALLFTVIAGKLAWLQLAHGAEYQKLAEEQNSRGIVLPAKRGNIYAKDYRTGDLFPLAQNSTTYTIFADPMLLENEAGLADLLVPHLYIPPEEKPEEATITSKAKAEKALREAEALAAAKAKAEAEARALLNSEPNATPNPNPTVVVSEVAPAPTADPKTETPANTPLAEIAPIDPKLEFETRLLEKLLTKSVVRRELGAGTPEELKLITDSHLPGITLIEDQISVNPMLIDDPEIVATKLATILNRPYTEIYPLLLRKRLRYVKLAGHVPAATKNEILKLDIRGIGAIPEYRRVYPEHNLASQIIGFLNHDEVGTYGIEGAENKTLAGKNGLRRTQVDPFNRQITVGDITINDAVDGSSLVLTIDRAIQELVERELTDAVDSQRADGGVALVMDPMTGAILALAQTPNFDPNNYAEAYEREEVTESDITHELEHDYVVSRGYRFPVFEEKQSDGSIKKVIYKNRAGPNVFAPKFITDPYEPGSVFKPIVMAAALDSGEVTPATRSPYTGPVNLHEKLANGKDIVIKNAEKYFGRETMTEVIEHSSNIGMTFVAQKLGQAAFYDYLKKFGFGEKTEIELEGENAGYFENYTKWSKSEFITKAFGQGITVNLIQMATAYSALANGGLLMKPYLIAEEIQPDGKRIVTEPKTVRRVISKETSAQISAILISSVRRGYAKRVDMPGYFIAGKTGTSQTYSKTGAALFGVGTTLAGFGGYAPATDPKYVMIVRLDRPRVSEWGEASAGVVFKNVTEELLKNYFAIPPKM